MCEHDAKLQLAVPSVQPPLVGEGAAPSTGSRRRRLWELSHECHCPVVGVCLPLDTLRRLVNKALGGKALADDYEVHVGAVAECLHRNRLSEALQNELDRRYARDVQRFKSAKTARALADLWTQAIRQGDVAGAFWAALSHPRCDAILQEVLCRDMHMLQHQAGANVRIDIAKFTAMLDENAVLTRELGRVQERSTRLLAEKSNEITRLGALHMRVQADNITKESRIAFLMEDLAALKASNPALDANTRLLKKIDQMADRHAELEAQNAALRHKLATAAKALEALNTEPPKAPKVDAAQGPEPRVSPVTLYLKQKNVLCVGGRTGNIANYRDLIERVGGRFAHHDGGLEDSQSVLDASLAAADLVICQTGCISHNAYWKVKDFCKRTGKRCVFVENPSTSSLVRGLEQISDTDAGTTQPESVAVTQGSGG
ncbi:MAG: DUF2325 domain-containing protein [Pseudomonadota bacterium]